MRLYIPDQSDACSGVPLALRFVPSWIKSVNTIPAPVGNALYPRARESFYVSGL